jgi:tetratricopeptide (TPR) repeat protein
MLRACTLAFPPAVLALAMLTARAALAVTAADNATPADNAASTQAMTHAPASLAEWARGARLFEGLGTFHRPITTDSAASQQYFDQGMRLLWAFNHDEAARSFAKSAQLDPGCAACYWGVALTVGPNYNVPEMGAMRARVAWDTLQKAQEHAAHASAVEQALIAALAARYPTAEPLGPDNLDGVQRAYASAMRQVAQRFPEDLDVQTLCAEAAMNVHAWRLWSADGQPVEGTREIEARLENVLRRDPRHPGANHYYIHVMEASPHPEKALAAAERLSGLMPSAGHLEHMPAHILQRVGRYEDAAEANRRGAAADETYFATTAAPGYYGMYRAHNYAFLAWSAAMEGRKAEALAAVQSVSQRVPLDMDLAMGDSGWRLSPQYAVLVRFGLWDEMLAIRAPQAQAPGQTLGWLYGRGVALAARGQIEAAREALAGIQQLRTEMGEQAGAGANPLHDVLDIAEPIVAARIAATEGRSEEAVAQLEKAVAAEDRLAYSEPSDWFFPARHLLGAELMLAGRASQAEQVYREDLRRNPANGWSLFGLAAALRAEGHAGAAARVTDEFRAAWQHADVRLPASAFWFAGADTTSCECQRTLSRDR